MTVQISLAIMCFVFGAVIGIGFLDRYSNIQIRKMPGSLKQKWMATILVEVLLLTPYLAVLWMMYDPKTPPLGAVGATGSFIAMVMLAMFFQHIACVAISSLLHRWNHEENRPTSAC